QHDLTNRKDFTVSKSLLGILNQHISFFRPIVDQLTVGLGIIRKICPDIIDVSLDGLLINSISRSLVCFYQDFSVHDPAIQTDNSFYFFIQSITSLSATIVIL